MTLMQLYLISLSYISARSLNIHSDLYILDIILYLKLINTHTSVTCLMCKQKGTYLHMLLICYVHTEGTSIQSQYNLS